MANKVVVIDYGIGNVFSVCNALNQVGADVSLTRDSAEIMAADRIILPGVGAFARAMEALKNLDLVDTLTQFKDTGRPFLGICIGMQVLMDGSEEFGLNEGLGFIPGTVSRIDKDCNTSFRVPHISWAELQKPESVVENIWMNTPLANFKCNQESVYFVHSYHCLPDNNDMLLAQAQYESVNVTAAIQNENLYGVQFHPERSGPAGQKFLTSFMSI